MTTTSWNIEAAKRLGLGLGLDREALARGLRLAFAAWLAFAIASLLHVGNAYWAAMPIWVVSQGAKGLLIERGIFRFVGTLVGAGFGFAALHLTANATLVLVLLSGWVVVNATMVHLLRGVQSYGALMAGMTAAVVILPSILQPDHSIALAVARVECTLIGVVVVTLVTGLWTPPSPRQDLYGRVRRLSRDAVACAGAILTDPPPADAATREAAVLRAMSEVQASASLVTAGSRKGYQRRHHVHALGVASLTVMAAARAQADRQRRWPDAARVDPSDLAAVADVLADSVAAPDAARPNSLARIERGDPRLAEALAALVEAEILFRTDVRSAIRTSGAATAFAGRATALAFQHDGRLALESGLIAGGATLVAAILGYASGWSAGSLAALGVCIFSMVLGSVPAPQQIVPVMLKGVSAGVAGALVYRFLVQPHVTSVPELVLSIAPFILIGGLARASSKTAGPALDANMCFMLASQAVLPAVSDPAAILNGSAALLLAAFIVAPGFMLLPTKRAREAARAIAAVRHDVIRMASSAAPEDATRRRARATRQVLRLGLHVELAANCAVQPDGSLLAAINLGEAIATIQAMLARATLEAATRQILAEALAALRRAGDDPNAIVTHLATQASLTSNAEAAECLGAAADGLQGFAGYMRG